MAVPTFPPGLQQLTDHWWWRPGMRMGRRIFACHLNAFGPDLQDAAAHYQHALEPIETLDLIPAEWLHLTMQDVGFTDEVSQSEIEEISVSATDRLSGMAPFELEFARPTVFSEGVTLTPVRGGDAVAGIRNAVRAAIQQVLGADHTLQPQHTEFHPHVSIAYANGPDSVERIDQALSTVSTRPVSERITHVSLIAMHRDNRMYQWREVNPLPLSGVHRDG